VTSLKLSFNRYGLIVALIMSTIALSWCYMLYFMTMNMNPVGQWRIADIGLLFVMWGIMMAGMMLPSAIPVIMLVDKLNYRRRQQSKPFTQTFYFMVGYLLAWLAYSLIATLIQWWLHHLMILSPMMISINTNFSAALLIFTGLYQWSPFKQKCLQLCRSPFSFISTHWKEGVAGAIRLGLKHGQYCLGCCWLLMALLFVTGVMNIKWILILSLIVIVEKMLPKGDVLSKVLGILLLCYGFYLFL